MNRMVIFADLEARGLSKDNTDRDALRARIAAGPVGVYYGCDPSADSLQVGNLVGLIVLRRFADAGHRAIALARRYLDDRRPGRPVQGTQSPRR